MKLKKIFEKHSWLVKPNKIEGGLECEGWTPESEDFIFYLEGATEDEQLESLKNLAKDFDVDEHVALWVDHRGKNGVPSSIRRLLEDAEWIKNELEQMAEEVEG